MKTWIHLSLAALVVAPVLFLSAACQGPAGARLARTGALAAGAAGGAGAGHLLSDGRPGAVLAGAAAGAGVTQLLLGRDPGALQDGFDLGYVQGQSDAIKRQYFLRLSAEEQAPRPAAAGRTRLYQLPGPGSLPDGTKLEPHTLAVRVQE